MPARAPMPTMSPFCAPSSTASRECQPMPISSIGAAHVAAALAALALGAIVLAMRKGTQLHRAMGMAYAAAMIVLCVTALMIYRINGHFGPFHVLALLSLATIFAG